MKNYENEAIAIRSLYLRQKEILVCVGRPYKETGKTWACSFWFKKNGKIVDRRAAFGVDSFQALAMALEGIRVALEKSGQTYSWIGGGKDPGFPMDIPSYYGLEFERKIITMVEREIEKKARELIAAGKKREQVLAKKIRVKPKKIKTNRRKKS